MTKILSYICAGFICLFASFTHAAVDNAAAFLILQVPLPSDIDQIILKEPVTSLRDKSTLPFSTKAKKNEYISFAPYYWPNPQGIDQPYIYKDSIRNHELVALGDAHALREMNDIVTKLAVRAYESHNPSLAQRAGDWLRVWMIDSKTAMVPHLEYAQCIPNTLDGGNSSGIIDMARFPRTLEGLQLLKSMDMDGRVLAPDEWRMVDEWLHGYYTWLTTSKTGMHTPTRHNNHVLYYYAQCAALAEYLGNKQQALSWINAAFDRFDSMVDSDGAQPHEINRADSYHYSIYTLQAWINLALIAERLGHPYWSWKSPQGTPFWAPYDFLYPYAEEAKPWAYPTQRRIIECERDWNELKAIAIRVGHTPHTALKK